MNNGQQKLNSWEKRNSRWITLGPLQRDKVGNPKRNQSWIFIGRNDADVEVPILGSPDVKSWLIGKDSDAGKDRRQEVKGTTEDEMVGWHHQLSEHEFVQTPGDGGQVNLACCSPLGCKESDTTEPLNNNFLMIVQEDRDQTKDNELWSWGGATESEFHPAEAAIIYGKWH